MEILGKCLGRLISLGLLMLILYFVCEFSTSAVVGFGNFNFSDEFYEFNKNGILLYIASIILVLGINFCLIYILQKNIYNKIVLLIFMIVGIIIMIFVIDRWMSWLEILFSKYQLYNYNVIEMGYENLFGNKTKAKAIITVTIVVFFSFNMLFENIEIILDDRTYIKEAFANKNNLMDILACELVIYLFWPAMTIMNRVNISNIIFWTAMIFTGILYLILNIIIWRRMIKYTKLERKEVVYIVISELGEGYFLHQLFKKEYKFLKQLYREQIILISKKEYQRIYKERKNDISLECYMTFYVKESEIQKNHLKDAAFHMAFFDYVGNTEKLNKFFYEVVIEDKSFKETIQQIVPYCNMISYKRSLKECLEIDQYAERKKKNLFVCNYIEMIRHLQNEMDTFESFKILLNMLEMLNYFYILIQISYQEWDVSSIIQQQSNELMKGTFGSWIRIRVFLSGEKQRKKILGNPKLNNKVKCFETMMESKIYICELINRLYQMIGVEKQCSNDINNLTLRASFEEMSKFRTYTRGHGVYTFTITDELNLSIMEIVKCWFLKLDENGLLEDDYSNLEQLGWILEYKNKMYFVYSYIKETDELEYHCFPDGTGLYLPYDIVE